MWETIKGNKKELGILSLISLFILTAAMVFDHFSLLNEKVVTGLLEEHTTWAPVLYMGLLAISGIFSFIPSTPIMIAGGIFFGLYYGFLYTYIGSMVGYIITFGIGKFLGKKYVEKLARKKEDLNRINNKIRDNGALALGAARLMPWIPYSIASYAAGITRINKKHYTAITFLGSIPVFLFVVLFSHYSSTILPHGKKIVMIGLPAVLLIATYLTYKYLRKEVSEKEKIKN